MVSQLVQQYGMSLAEGKWRAQGGALWVCRLREEAEQELVTLSQDGSGMRDSYRREVWEQMGSYTSIILMCGRLRQGHRKF